MLRTRFQHLHLCKQSSDILSLRLNKAEESPDVLSLGFDESSHFSHATEHDVGPFGVVCVHGGHVGLVLDVVGSHYCSVSAKSSDLGFHEL